MNFGRNQLLVELDQLSFARVVSIRQPHEDQTTELTTCPRDDVALDHFYGFGKLNSGESVFFKRNSHLGTKGLSFHLGPVKLAPRMACRKDVPHRNTVLVGKVSPTARGPVFDWWIHGAEPIQAFARAIRTRRLKPSSYQSLALGPELSTTPDDLYCLARLVMGDIGLVAGQLKRNKPYHPSCKKGYVRSRGLELSSTPTAFVFFAAFLTRSEVLFDRWLAYLKRYKLKDKDGDMYTCANLQLLLSNT